MRSYSTQTKAIVIGVLLGIIFSLVQVSSSERLSAELLVMAYAVVLIFVAMVFVPSIKWGLVSGLVATVCEPIGEFVYYSIFYGTSIAAGMLPYSAAYLPRLVVLPLAGLVGGAIAAEFNPTPERAQKKQKESGKLTRRRGD